MVLRSEEHTHEREGFPDLALLALSHPTRRWLLRRTLGNYLPIAALARGQAISRTGIQKHVNVLHEAGLVTKVPRGRDVLVRADVETLIAVREVLEHLESFYEEARHPTHWWERL